MLFFAHELTIKNIWLYNICSGFPYGYYGVYFYIEKSPIKSIMKSD